jgi:hypothetical protein
MVPLSNEIIFILPVLAAKEAVEKLPSPNPSHGIPKRLYPIINNQERIAHT